MPVIAGPEQFARRFPSLVTGAGEAGIAALWSALRRVTVPADTVLITYRGRSDHLYLVWDGELIASIEAAGKRMLLGRISAGKWVGEVTLLDHGPATATVVAAKESVLLVLSREEFDELRERHPRVGALLMQALSRDLAMRLRLTQIGVMHDVGAGADRRRATEESPEWRVRAGRHLMGAPEDKG